MKSMQHDLTLKVCLDTFHDHKEEGRAMVEAVFEAIEKAKAAILAKGGKVRSFTFNNKINREDNLDGMVASLTFDTVFPFDCEASLEFSFMQHQLYETGPRMVTMLIDCKVKP